MFRNRTMKKQYVLYSLTVLAPAVLILAVIMARDPFRRRPFYSEEAASGLVFSHKSGFYEEPFYLEIKAEGKGQIFYTTDGSEPNASHTLYTGPVLISDATPNENLYAAREDLTVLGFQEEILHYTGTSPRPNVTPDYPVDKCTVIRAVWLDEAEQLHEIQTQSFFVGYSEKRGYENLPVISFVADPYRLFDYENGVYVLGKDWDTYVNAGFSWDSGAWTFWGANYQRRGYEAERKMTVQFFDREHQYAYQKNGGFRIHGLASRARLPKSMNFYAREEYDGTKTFDFPLLSSTDYRPRKFILYNGSYDESLFRDYLISELTQGMAFSSMRYEPCVMFLNGEYWGVYQVAEKYDENYVEYYYGVNRDDVVLIKDHEVEAGLEEDIVLYDDMRQFIEENDMSDPALYAQACEMIDVESYTEYFAALLCIARCGDWPRGNIALWRVRTPGVGGYADGKWRWMLYDIEADAITEDVIDQDTLSEAADQDAMLASLLKNEVFRKGLADAMKRFMDEVYTPDSIRKIADVYEARMADAMEVHYRRFFGDFNPFHEEMDEVRNFFENRRPAVEKMIEGLYQTQ